MFFKLFKSKRILMFDNNFYTTHSSMLASSNSFFFTMWTLLRVSDRSCDFHGFTDLGELVLEFLS